LKALLEPVEVPDVLVVVPDELEGWELPLTVDPKLPDDDRGPPESVEEFEEDTAVELDVVDTAAPMVNGPISERTSLISPTAVAWIE